jgi:Predicted transcriptional regulators
MKIINNVKSLRESAGMTQRELAGKTGISRETIAQYETQRSVPSVGKAYIIADAFGCGIEQVYEVGKEVNYEDNDD